MINAILVLRIHILELEKVNELCRDFAERYIEALKIKLNSDNIFKIDDEDDEEAENGTEADVDVEADIDTGVNTDSERTSGLKRKTDQGGKPLPAKKKRKKLKMPHEMLNSKCTGLSTGIESKYQIHPETSLSSITLKPLRSNRNDFESPRCRSQLTSESMSDEYELLRKNELKNELDDSTSSNNDDDNENVFEDYDEEITIDDEENDDDAKSLTSSTLAGKASSTDLNGKDDVKDSSKLKRGILPKSATNVMKKWLFQHLVVREIFWKFLVLYQPKDNSC